MIGDPGVEKLFDLAVYERGAMTLQALRNEIGDEKFWRIIRRWAASRSGGHGTTPQFIRLAERIAGQDLDGLFDAWLFTGSKPPPEAVAGGTARYEAERPRAGRSLRLAGRLRAADRDRGVLSINPRRRARTSVAGALPSYARSE